MKHQQQTGKQSHKTPKSRISFEFSPPKEGKEESFIEVIKSYDQFNPHHMSLTYGALGTSNKNSQSALELMLNYVKCGIKSHLTCGGSTVQQVKDFLEFLKKTKIRSILALRGDIVQENGDFRYATDLMAYLNRFYSQFALSVAGYPEIHPESPSLEFELAVLKRKIKYGAQEIVTQLFFDVDSFLRYRDFLSKKGVHLPIEAGLMTLDNYYVIEKITKMSQIKISKGVEVFLNKAPQQTQEEREKFALDYLVQQIEKLKKNDVYYFHFYALNKKGVVYRYCREVQKSNE